MQRLADRVSAVFVPVVIGIALATLAGWLAAAGDASDGVHRRRRGADHRLPVRARPGDADRADGRHGRGAQLGILIKGPEVLEQTRRIDTIVLDKTGTVTEGRLELDDVDPPTAPTRGEVLRLAGAVEAASEHPDRAGDRRAARAEVGALPAGRRLPQRAPGVGVVGGVVEGHERRGRPRRDGAASTVALGRRRPRATLARRATTGQADERRGGRASCAALGLDAGAR